MMTPRASCVASTANLVEAATLMRNCGCGFLPVCKNDKLVGVITDRDIVVRAIADNKSPHATNVEHVMTKGVIYCTTRDTLKTVAEKMGSHKVRRLAVLDDNKRVAGVLSIDDIALKGGDAQVCGEIMKGIINE